MANLGQNPVISAKELKLHAITQEKITKHDFLCNYAYLFAGIYSMKTDNTSWG